MTDREWNVYLAGEIHTSWRDEIRAGAKKRRLDVEFSGPELDHPTSDDIGVRILGPEPDKFWHDHKSARINAIRTRTALADADLVVVRFGDKYRQWNAAFDAGQAVAMDTPLITLHDPALDHALKEINAAALATCRTVEQVVEILAYVAKGR